MVNICNNYYSYNFLHEFIIKITYLKEMTYIPIVFKNILWKKVSLRLISSQFCPWPTLATLSPQQMNNKCDKFQYIIFFAHMNKITSTVLYFLTPTSIYRELECLCVEKRCNSLSVTGR